MNRTFFETAYRRHAQSVETRLRSEFRQSTPRSVYDPARYVISTGGKRLRAVLALIACEAAGGRSVQALPAACAMEVLHNFTLVHDDIMDHAALRRGKPTVHQRWDTAVAVLAGDTMAAQAYRLLLQTSGPARGPVASRFTDAFIQVCEGQGFDKEFEARRGVTMGEYTAMITQKTACVIATSAEIGGLVGGATPAQARALRRYGLMLGRAFQIRDDLLDITGEEEEFGKSIGGDIREGKKTFLLIEALRRARGADRRLLDRVVRRSRVTGATVRAVRGVYERLGVLTAANRQIARWSDAALDTLIELPPNRSTAMLGWLAGRLLARSS